MQGSWYKYFLLSLRYYYRSKGFFLLFFKSIFILKIISIILDIYFGFFPNILKDKVFWFYFLKLYSYIYLNFFYWFNSFWLFVLFILCCFYFFFRVGSVDNVEVLKRLKLKEQELKNKKNESNINKYMINIKQKKYILKKKVKTLEKRIFKHL